MAHPYEVAVTKLKCYKSSHNNSYFFFLWNELGNFEFLDLSFHITVLDAAQGKAYYYYS